MSSPGKPQLDEEKNNDHYFFHNTKREGKLKSKFKKLRKGSVGKDSQQNVSTKKSKKFTPNNVKETFYTEFDIKETLVLIA